VRARHAALRAPRRAHVRLGRVGDGATHVGPRTAKRDVLSPAQYLEHGQRTGEARRAWRVRIYGRDILGKTDPQDDARMCEPGTVGSTEPPED